MAEVTRRRLLQIGVGLAAASVLPAQALDLLTHIPVVNNPAPPLVSADGGILRRINYELRTDPAIRSVSGQIARRFISNRDKGRQDTLPELLQFAIERSKNFTNSDQYEDPARIRVEDLWRASVALAAVSTGMADKRGLLLAGFPPEELENISPDFKGTLEFYWGKNGIGWTFPKLFKMEGPPDRLNRFPTHGGGDGLPHFSAHLFLTIGFLRSTLYGLEDHKRLPLILDKMLDRQGITDPYEQTYFLSVRLGYLYELSRLVSPVKIFGVKTPLMSLNINSLPIFNDPSEGIFDSSVKGDYASNRLGAAAAIALARKALVGGNNTEIFEELRDPLIESFPAGQSAIYNLWKLGA